MDTHWKHLTKHNHNNFHGNIKNICPVFIEKNPPVFIEKKNHASIQWNLVNWKS